MTNRSALFKLVQRSRRFLITVGMLSLAWALQPSVSLSAAEAPPKVHDPKLKLQLFAEAPDILTPIGATFDPKGRLLVIESHTHQREKNYQGPAKDRIRILEDTDGDGRADRFRTFYEGTESTMSLAAGKDGWIYVATRMKIFRIRDTKGADVADETEELLHLETKGNYPHDGLCGLAFDNKGELYFGMGENLGEAWSLVAKDGVRLRGAGEGGVFHCAADGRELRRIAIGIWNPFGICVDPLDRVFAVDNDPDASPPCRLLHIVPTGDYGFNFKYGRPGKHPLQAWNGELPGTLPYAAATGEAPSALIPYHGKLWATSWGDHRIERFQLIPWDATFRASREIVVEGNDNFRPVGLAIAPDDSLYVTDWVDKSYPVHGKGRVWRLSWTEKPPENRWPEMNRESTESDPFLRQARVAGLVQKKEASWSAARQEAYPLHRLAQLQALRWQELTAADPAPPPKEDLAHFLRDEDARVRIYAMRWIADDKLDALRPELEAATKGLPHVTPELFLVWAASLEILDHGKPVGNSKSPNPDLIRTALDSKMPLDLRALALKFSPPAHPKLSVALLTEWTKSENGAFRREAVRTLALRGSPDAFPALAKIAGDREIDGSLRADAIAGISAKATEHRDLLKSLANDEVPAVKMEATRSFKAVAQPVSEAEDKPAPSDLNAWIKLTEKPGDAAAGWRVFFTASNGRCAACHRFDGRGNSIGPDLTGIIRGGDRSRALQSILRPSSEIAPQFVAWNIVLEDGRVLLGMSQGFNDAGTREFFLGPDGKTFDLDVRQIAERKASTKSLMPDDLEKSLSVQELRDILKLLESAP